MTDSSNKVFSSESKKESKHIIHKGLNSPYLSEFAASKEECYWPEDLWSIGTKVYDINNEDIVSFDQNDPKSDILVFDSKFESGNLCEAFHLYDDSYHLILEYDRNPSESCQWFYFQISNIKKEKHYEFFISGFHKSKGLYTSGSKVFWYSEIRAEKQGISWSRGGYEYDYCTIPNPSYKGKKRSTLRFLMDFPYDDDNVFLCYAIPYTYHDLINDIEKWSNEFPKNYFKAETLCQSLGGKDVPMITITNSEIKTEKDYILVSSRIHPGESNSSFLLRGFVEHLEKQCKNNPTIMQNFVFVIIPMLNVDGVIEGFYRVSLSGNDLNRMWGSPDLILHPEIYHSKRLFQSIVKEKNVNFYIDFHGHSRQHGTFAYGCPNSDIPNLNDSEKVFPRLLSMICDAFSWNHCVFSYPEDRKTAGRIVVRTEMDVINSYTIETSFGGIVSGPRAGYLYDRTLWEELGAKCCEALVSYANEDRPSLIKYISNELRFCSPPRQRMENEKPFPQVSSELSDNHAKFKGYHAIEYKPILECKADSITCQAPDFIQAHFLAFPN